MIADRRVATVAMATSSDVISIETTLRVLCSATVDPYSRAEFSSTSAGPQPGVEHGVGVHSVHPDPVRREFEGEHSHQLRQARLRHR
jgi:hypothetical protein